MSSCGTGLFPTPDPINPDLNASALTAVGGFGGIYVQWTLAEGTLAGMSHTQIYRGLANDFSLAIPLHRIKGDHYFDTISDGNSEDTYYYWIRHYDTANQAGNLIGPASASFIEPVADVIEDLAGQIDQSHLNAGLSFEIDKITTLDGSLTQEIIDRTNAVDILTTALNNASSDFDNVRAALIDETNARITADSAQVDTINGLGVRVNDAEASILDLEVVSAGGYCEIGGIPNATHATQSACEGAGGTWKSTAALAASVNTLNSSVGDLETDLTTLDGDVDTRIDASIASIDYTAVVGHCEIGGTPNGSYTSQSACTGAGGTWVTTTALAASVDNYIVNNDQDVAALQITATAHNNDINALKTEYFMKTSVTAPNGQQLVGGFGVVNDGITIDAGFDVDRFWVGRSDANGVKPFYVSGSDVLINSAYIGELSADKITSGTITGRAISGGTIDGATITGGVIETTSGNGKRITLNGSTNRLSFHDSSDSERVSIDDATVDDGYIHINGSSSYRGLTSVNCGIGAWLFSTNYALYATSPTGTGVYSNAPFGRALDAQTNSGYGVYSYVSGSGQAGYFYSNTSSNPTVQITNDSGGTGIRIQANTGYGVHATSNGSGKAAVYGVGSGAVVGVGGTSTSGRGVQGYSTSGYGVYGLATQTTGLNFGGFFQSSSSSGRGVQGNVTGSGSVNYGGYFDATSSALGRGVFAQGGFCGGYFSGGAYSAYMTHGVRLAGGGVASFTGYHDALLPKTDVQPEVGDIVVITGIANKASVNDVIPNVTLATTSESKASYGVISNVKELYPYGVEPEAEPILIGSLKNLDQTTYNNKRDNFNLVSCNGLGEGQINVCDANGDIEVGDFISTSAVAGKGQLYTGNDMRVVVAKALEPVDWSTETETTKMIACVYMCS